MIQASSQVMFRVRLQELLERRMSYNANTVLRHSKDLGRGVTSSTFLPFHCLTPDRADFVSQYPRQKTYSTL